MKPGSVNSLLISSDGVEEKRSMIANGAFLKGSAIFIALSILSCCGNSHGTTYGATATGTIQKQEGSSYMYGTHILLDDAGKTLYALKSDTINLDNYNNQKVTVKGDLVEGYPVDGGPDYLNVKSVE